MQKIFSSLKWITPFVFLFVLSFFINNEPLNAQTSSFSLGDTVKVISRVRVRSSGSLYATVSGYQEAGSSGKVIEGPVQSDGVSWYKVDYALSPDGWSSGSYLINQVNLDSPSRSQSAKFTIGQRVKTTANLNVRGNPSSRGSYLGLQFNGSLGTVVEGSVYKHGYNWWKIDYDNAPDGWSIENHLSVYSLVTPPPYSQSSYVTPPPPIPLPTISSLNPTSGPVGTLVTINGSGFETSDMVKFGVGYIIPIYNLVRPAPGSNDLPMTTSLSFVVPTAISPCDPQLAGSSLTILPCPANAIVINPGDYKVSVIKPTGQSSNSVTFTVTGVITPPPYSQSSYVTPPPPVPLPTISSLNPTSGPVGTTVTINGSGFTTSSYVRFGTGDRLYPKYISSTLLSFVVPDGLSPCMDYMTGSPTAILPCPAYYMPITPGTYNVLVVNGDRISNVVPFTVTGVVTPPPPPYTQSSYYSQSSYTTSQPIISLISPTSGPVGTLVTIKGSGFSQYDMIKFGEYLITPADRGAQSHSFYVPTGVSPCLPQPSGSSLTLAPCPAVAYAINPGVYNVSVVSPTGAASNTVAFTVTGVVTPPPYSQSSYVTPPVTPIVTLSANPTTINSGGSSTLSWTSTNATAVYLSGPYSGPPPLSAYSCLGTQVTNNGTKIVYPTETSMYMVCALNGDSRNAVANVFITVSPVNPPPVQPPTILSMNPSSGPVGTKVVLNGSGFTSSGNSINFGYGYIPDAILINNNQLAFVVPESLIPPCNFVFPTPCPGAYPQPTPLGVYDVSVVNTNGISNKVLFTVTSITPPPTCYEYRVCDLTTGEVKVFNSCNPPLPPTWTTQLDSCPIPSSTKFTIGQRVKTTANVNVRVTASYAGTPLGTQPLNSLGTVTNGPVSVGGYIWWNINYDNAPDGWSAENFLTAIGDIPPLSY